MSYNKDLRVAIFTGCYNHIVDGVSRSLNRLVESLEKNDVPVIIFGPAGKKPAFKHHGEFVPVPSIPLPGRTEYRLTTGIDMNAMSRLQAFDPTLMHIASPDWAGLQALKFAKNRNLPLVSSFHTNFASYLKYYRLKPAEKLAWKYIRWFYNQFDQVYVPTTSMREELREQGLSCDMRLWARGVDTKLFSPDKRNMAWRRKNGFKDSDKILTFVSRLVWEKNLASVIDTARTIRGENSNIKTMVVGDGPARNEMQALMPEAKFTGFMDGADLATAYASSDMFIFPSETETFGNVTLEALASGLPAIVADANGSKSLVEQNVTGFTASAKDSKKFAEYALHLAGNDDRRATMSRAARNRVTQEYRWETINSRLIEHYREALYKPNGSFYRLNPVWQNVREPRPSEINAIA